MPAEPILHLFMIVLIFLLLLHKLMIGFPIIVHSMRLSSLLIIIEPNH